MSELFYRDGRPYTGTKAVTLLGKTVVTEKRVCGRCGGQGGLEAWRHTGWTCYQCNGTGKGANVNVPLYAADKLAKLNATAEKAAKTRATKAAKAAAIEQAKTDTRRVDFESKHVDVLRWLRSLDLNKGFLFDMRDCADRRACWSDAQSTAVYASWERTKERDLIAAKSQHVGSVGGRIKGLHVKVECVRSFQRPAFNSYGQDEVVYITTLRDDAGNCIVVMSPSFRQEKDAVLTIAGTVKAHSEFRGQLQTQLQRVKVEG